MIEFKQNKHMYDGDRTVIEVWKDGKMIGTIYPTEKGVRLISKYLMTYEFDDAKDLRIEINDKG